jgi:hypothetical protein
MYICKKNKPVLKNTDMKKIILFISLFSLSFGVFSQSFSLSDPSGVIPDGGSRTYTTTANISILPGTYYVFVHNISGAPLWVKCMKEIVDTIPGTENGFCWGSCFTPDVYDSPNPILIANGDSSDLSGFSPDYKPNGQTGDSHIRYVFYENGNRANQVTYIATFHATPAGVNSYAKSFGSISNSPNPASDYTIVEYSIPSNFQAPQLVVKNLLGAVVFTSELTSLSGKINLNTSTFVDGIYFYSIQSNNTPLATKKMIIRH